MALQIQSKMMDCIRVDVKVFLGKDETRELEDLIPVFHRWIQEQNFDELLIDVADYRHVPHGPGLMVIAHEAQYSLDLGEGRPGLLYSRRREPEVLGHAELGMGHRLRSAIARALAACLRLELEETLERHYLFCGDELMLRFNDRLAVPNTATAFAELHALLVPILHQLYPNTPVKVRRGSTESPHLSIMIKAAISPSIMTLLERLEPVGGGSDQSRAMMSFMSLSNCILRAIIKRLK